MAETETVCNICQRKLSTSFGLNIHKGKMHNSKKQRNQKAQFFCFRCDKSYRHSSSLERHMQTKHRKRKITKKADVSGGIPKRRCPFCRSSFAKVRDLKLHIKEFHFTLKSFLCEVCGSFFLNEDILTQHQKEHSPENGSTGTGYYNPYIAPKNQVPHMGEDHTPSSSPGVSASCGTCYLLFPTQNMLDSHIVTEHFDFTEYEPSLPAAAAAASEDNAPYPNTRSRATRSKSCNRSSSCGICNDVRRKCIKNEEIEGHLSENVGISEHDSLALHNTKSCHIAVCRSSATDECYPEMTAFKYQECQAQAPDIDISASSRNVSCRASLINNKQGPQTAAEESDIQNIDDSEDIQSIDDSQHIQNIDDSEEIQIVSDSEEIEIVSDSEEIEIVSDSEDIQFLSDSEDIQIVRDSEDNEICPPSAFNSTVKGRCQEATACSLRAGSSNVILPIASPMSQSFSDDLAIVENTDEQVNYKLEEERGAQLKCTVCGHLFNFFQGMRVHMLKHNVRFK